MKQWFSCIYIVIMMSVMGAVQAAVNIEITQGVESALPIAVVPFAEKMKTSKSGAAFAQIIVTDLKNSGQFKPLNPEMMGFDDPMRLYQLELSQWPHLGVEHALLGDVSIEKDGTYTINARLMDVFNTQEPVGTIKDGELVLPETSTGPRYLFNRSFHSVQKDELRRLAHHISDLVYETLTGIKGVFSTRIAYVHVNHEPSEEQPYSLVVSDMDGHNPVAIFKSSEPVMSPAWMPDGQSLLFVSFENHRSGIYKINIQSGLKEKLSQFPRINGAPSISPDGTQLAMVLSKDGAPKLYLYKMDTGTLNQLTTGYSIDTEPSWAPDGQSLIFTSNRSGPPQLYHLTLRDNRVERVTFDGAYNARARYAPDGRSLVYVQRGEDGVFRIVRKDLQTNIVTLLTKNMDYTESPTISPNGEMILYAAQLKGEGILAQVSMDGRIHLQIPSETGSVQEPAWSTF